MAALHLHRKDRKQGPGGAPGLTLVYGLPALAGRAIGPPVFVPAKGASQLEAKCMLQVFLPPSFHLPKYSKDRGNTKKSKFKGQTEM